MGKMNSAKSSKRNRINFTVRQLEIMDKVFQQTQYPDVLVIEKLSTGLDIPLEKILTWFQNRRSKFRRGSKKDHIDWMRQQLFTEEPASDSPSTPVSGVPSASSPSSTSTDTSAPCHVLTKTPSPKATENTKKKTKRPIPTTLGNSLTQPQPQPYTGTSPVHTAPTQPLHSVLQSTVSPTAQSSQVVSGQNISFPATMALPLTNQTQATQLPGLASTAQFQPMNAASRSALTNQQSAAQPISGFHSGFQQYSHQYPGYYQYPTYYHPASYNHTQSAYLDQSLTTSVNRYQPMNGHLTSQTPLPAQFQPVNSHGSISPPYPSSSASVTNQKSSSATASTQPHLKPACSQSQPTITLNSSPHSSPVNTFTSNVTSTVGYQPSRKSVSTTTPSTERVQQITDLRVPTQSNTDLQGQNQPITEPHRQNQPITDLQGQNQPITDLHRQNQPIRDMQGQNQPITDLQEFFLEESSPQLMGLEDVDLSADFLASIMAVPLDNSNFSNLPSNFSTPAYRQPTSSHPSQSSSRVNPAMSSIPAHSTVMYAGNYTTNFNFPGQYYYSQH